MQNLNSVEAAKRELEEKNKPKGLIERKLNRIFGAMGDVKTMFIQGFKSGFIVGGIVGLATVGISSSATTYVMVFVAGNFIYIASDIWRHLFKARWMSNIFQFLFFCIGVGAMYGIKIYEQAQGAH